MRFVGPLGVISLVGFLGACSPDVAGDGKVPLAEVSDGATDKADIGMDAALAPCDDDCDVRTSRGMWRFTDEVTREDTPAVAIINRRERHVARLVLAAWPDGEIIWSDNTVRGGDTYRKGRVPTRELARVLTMAASDELLTHPILEKYIEHNGSTVATSIAICSGRFCLERTAAFEAFENEQLAWLPNLDSHNIHGMRPLDGRSWHEVVADDLGPAAEEYIEYRRLWTESRQMIVHSLIQAAEEVEVASE